jgi:hypothetical protein
MTAYAAIGDVTALFDAPPTGARLTRMTSLLATVTDELIEKADGRDYPEASRRRDGDLVRRRRRPRAASTSTPAS